MTHRLLNLTPQAQLSIQWTIRDSAWKKVLFVRLNQKEVYVLGAKFYQLSYGVNHFRKFPKFFFGRVVTLTIINLENFALGAKP